MLPLNDPHAAKIARLRAIFFRCITDDTMREIGAKTVELALSGDKDGIRLLLDYATTPAHLGIFRLIADGALVRGTWLECLTNKDRETILNIKRRAEATMEKKRNRQQDAADEE
jgi:hypothetical protein